MSRHIRLSFILGLNDPRPPAIPEPELTPFLTIENDSANVQILRLANHTGTHVDAPRHVIEDGLCITDFTEGEFIYSRPVVVDLKLGDKEIVQPEHLVKHLNILKWADIALFRFGYGAIRRSDPDRYSLSAPGFGTASACWLRENCANLRAVGMDIPSLACISHLDDTMQAHNELLSGKERRFLIIEDMNLEQDLNGLIEVRLCPWLVEGMDSSPCNVVGMIK